MTERMGQQRLAAPDGKPAKTWAAARQVWNARWKAKNLGLPEGDLNWIQVARLYYLPCAYCGQMPALGADHIIPLAASGENTLANMAPACASCNNAKSNTVGWRKKKPWPCSECGVLIVHIPRTRDRRTCSTECLRLSKQRRFARIQWRGSGVQSSSAKLTLDQVADIKAQYSGQRGDIARLARQYGVSRYPISQIVKGRSYR